MKQQLWSKDSYESITDFATIVNRSKESYSSRIFINPYEENIGQLTFVDLFHFVCGFESFLSDHGINETDRCAVISHNSTALVLQFIGLIATGRTFIPINPNSSIREINFILEDCAPEGLLFSSGLREKIESIHDWCPILEVSSDDEFIAGMIDAGQSKGALDATPNAESLAEIVYTSGTTGQPKGVLLSHKNLITDVFGLGQLFEFSDSDVFLTVAPLFHNSGQILTTLAPLYCGATTTAIRSDMGFINFWNYVDQFQPTWTLVMPAHVALMLERAAPSKSRTLKGILCGGAPLQNKVQIDFEEKFSAQLYPNYGLTESTSVATCARPGDPDRISGSAGKPLGINDVEVFTSNGEQATAGVVGEIRIRGNNICSGYLNRPEATSRKIVNGWLHTGDLGVFDDNGALRVVDRLDNLVIVGGENVYPTEIERLLPELEGLQEGIVLSLPDRIMGSELVLVFRSSFSSAPIKEWRQRLLQQLSSFKVPRRFIRASDLGLTDFPKAANGKVQRSKIQSRLNDFFGVVSDESQAGRQTTHDSETLQKVKLILLNILQIDEIGDLDDMDSLPSWDSINHLNLVMTLEQDFSISFNAKQITEMTSLPAIVAAVEKLKNQQ